MKKYTGQQLLAMNKQQLLEIAKEQQRVINQQLVHLQKRGLAPVSPAYLKRLREVGGREERVYYSTPSRATKATIIRQIKDMQYMEQLKTLTERGTIEYRNSIESIFPGLTGLDNESVGKFFDTLERIKEKRMLELEQLSSHQMYVTWSEVYNPNATIEQNMELFENELSTKYTDYLDYKKQLDSFYSQNAMTEQELLEKYGDLFE